jgi:hypothetical protein
MRKLLVIGGEGNMSGMSADTFPDDMLGLIKALKDDPAHDFILFHFTERFFMPPEDPEAIIPLFAETGIVQKILLQIVGDEAFGKLIRRHPPHFSTGVYNRGRSDRPDPVSCKAASACR